MSLCRAAEEIRCIVLRFDNLLVSIMVGVFNCIRSIKPVG